MDRIRVRGGNVLHGEIAISGAKNSALKLMCAGLLTAGELRLGNMPVTLRDIVFQADLLRHLGCDVEFSGDGAVLCAKGVCDYTAPYEIVSKMRASILVLGPLLARFGKAKVSLPGGCAIGSRPVDMHIKALEEMGAEITIEGGYILASAPEGRLCGAEILFPKVSVGATENLMMAATLADGVTILNNAALEPEIVDLGECLIKMGAKIEGLGSSRIRIEGVELLNGAEHDVVSDRIEAGTYLLAVVMAGGKLRLRNARLRHLGALVGLLTAAGVSILEDDGDILVEHDGSRLLGIDVMTDSYPGFPTDLQAQFMAMLTVADGAAMVTETIFENRFMHVPELNRMGADITVQGHSAIIRGVDGLNGAKVMATDLRASVALVLAALVAKGETVISRIYHLERGYEDIVGKLSACGVDIEKF